MENIQSLYKDPIDCQDFETKGNIWVIFGSSEGRLTLFNPSPILLPVKARICRGGFLSLGPIRFKKPPLYARPVPSC